MCGYFLPSGSSPSSASTSGFSSPPSKARSMSGVVVPVCEPDRKSAMRGSIPVSVSS